MAYRRGMIERETARAGELGASEPSADEPSADEPSADAAAASSGAGPREANRTGSERKHVQRKTAELRREEILDAAIRLVSQKGFAAVTLRDVAAEIDVAHGLLRHYFDSRDDLLAAAFDRAVSEELASTCDTDPDPVAAIASWLGSLPREYYLVWVDAWSEAPRNPALLESLRRHHLDCEVRLAAIIGRGIRDGVFRTDDPANAARILTATADGLAVQQHAIEVIDAADYDRLVFGQVERMLGLAAGSVTPAPAGVTRGSWLVA